MRRDDEQGLRIDEALEFMMEALASGEDREFQIGIVGYFVQGVRYSADSLWVSADEPIGGETRAHH